MTEPKDYRVKKRRRERYLSLRGIEHCIYEWGEAESPLLVYLHGWADTGANFQFVVDALAEDWFVVAPDWRGFGRTRYRAETYWFPDYLADLHQLLSHYAPECAVNLVGHSMGANIAALFAGIFPEKVAYFVNVEGFGLPDSDPAQAPQRYRDWIEAMQEPIRFTNYADFDALAHRVQKRSPSMSAGRSQFVAREWARQDEDGSVTLRADPNHKLPNAVLYRRAEAEACWRRIIAETLLISGDRGPLSRSLDALETLPFPSARHQVINGCGHMLHFEAAEALAAAIEDFLPRPL